MNRRHVRREVVLALAAIISGIATLAPARPVAAAGLVALPQGFEAGDRAPNFGAVDQNGAEQSLYDFRGTYVLLDFSVMWCAPSNHMAADEDQLIADVNAAGHPFTYVTMLLEDSGFNATTQRSAQQWATRYHLTAPVLQLDGQSVVSSRPYDQLVGYDGSSGPGFPTLVLVDPNGTILEVHLGYQSLSDIEALIPPLTS